MEVNKETIVNGAKRTVEAVSETVQNAATKTASFAKEAYTSVSANKTKKNALITVGLMAAVGGLCYWAGSKKSNKKSKE